MKSTALLAAPCAALILCLAAVLPQDVCAQRTRNGMTTDNSETPVGPVSKNRPPAPTGHTVKSAYPEGFLTLSQPSVLPGPSQTSLSNADRDRPVSGFQPTDVLFLVGAITAICLFMAVAWIDHIYRLRLQSIISQNNRLLNGEDVDLIDEAPVVGIPLFLGTQEAIGDDISPGLKHYLAETADDLTKPGATT
ncbi:MAG: hypothetical protein ACOX6D_00850 [Thermoguttaceae bacterium]|jgi:hypothetical protein